MKQINIYIYIILFIAGGIGGMILNNRITKAPVCPEINIPKCPDMACPEAVTIQQLDMTELKKIRGDFHYSPQFHGNVTIKNDTTKLK